MSKSQNLEKMVQSASKYGSRNLEKLITATFDSLKSGKIRRELEIGEAEGVALKHFPEGLELGEDNLGIFANEKIQAGDTVMGVSMQKAFTPVEFVNIKNLNPVDLKEEIRELCKGVFRNDVRNQQQLAEIVTILVQIWSNSKIENPHKSFCDFILSHKPTTSSIYFTREAQGLIRSQKMKTLIQNFGLFLNSLCKEIAKSSRLHRIEDKDTIKFVNLIRSRFINFDIEDPMSYSMPKLMCPVVDLLNHSFTPNCYLKGRYDTALDDSILEVVALKEIEIGEELLINYGNYDNDNLFMRFGFVDWENPNDFYNLDYEFGEVMEDVFVFDNVKKQILATGKMEECSGVKLYQNKFERDSLNSLRVLLINESDYEKSPDILTRTFKDFGDKINDDNERRVFEFLVSQIEAEKVSVEESLGDLLDFGNLETAVDDPSQKLIIEAQSIEVTTLENSLKYFQSELQKL